MDVVLKDEKKSLLFDRVLDWHLSVSIAVNTIQVFIDQNRLLEFHQYQKWVAEQNYNYVNSFSHSVAVDDTGNKIMFLNAKAFSEIQTLEVNYLRVKSLGLSLFNEYLGDIDECFMLIGIIVAYPINQYLTHDQINDAYSKFSKSINQLLTDIDV